MNCEKARDLILTDFIDSEVSPEDKRDLLQHLVKCESCRKLMSESEEFLVDAFADAPRPEPSDEVWEKIAVHISKPVCKYKTSVWSWLGNIFLAQRNKFALALAGGIVVIIISTYQTPSSAPVRLTRAETAVLSLVEDDSRNTAIMLQNINYETSLEKILF